MRSRRPLASRTMRKLALSIGLIGVALALVAAPALGAYKTSPNEGRAVSKSVIRDYPGPSSRWPFRGCWRIGPGGAGWWVPLGQAPGVLRGGVVCRFSTLPITSPYGTACLLREFAVKQAKPVNGRKSFRLEEVSRGNSDRVDGPWCSREPGAEEPPPPIGAIGPNLFS